MSGENLKHIYRIRDRSGERILHGNSFPFVIGGSPAAVMRIAGLDEKEEAAYVGISEEGLFVQPVEKGVPVWHNRRRLKESARLLHGDILQIGSSEIIFRIEESGGAFHVFEPGGTSEPFLAESQDESTSQIEISPIPFRSNRQRPRKSPLRWMAWFILLVVLSILCASAWFVFTAKQVVIKIAPDPDQISLSGGMISPSIGPYYLLRPGEYTINASKRCYHPLEQRIVVTHEKNQTVNLTMERLPGLVTLGVYQAESPSVLIDAARVRIDGEEVGITPLQELKVKPGRRHIQIQATNYQDLESDIEIEGCGVPQSHDFALTPLWADVTVVTIPEGANIRVDGNEVGKAPLELELLPGSHELEVSADGYKTWRTQLDIEPNKAEALDNIQLLPADGTLVLNTNPAGATVTVEGRYVGKTPLKVPLSPDSTKEVLISKAGYEKLTRKVNIASAKIEQLTVDLKPIEGIINLIVEPEDAELLIDGESWGMVRRELRLSAVEHELEIRKEGLESFRTKITPRPGFPQELEVSLGGGISEKPSVPDVIKAVNGYTLKLIRPGSFIMGASRREQGRRSNETLRKVELQRPFYMGLYEVTNREFRSFLAEHDSGSIKEHSLNRDELPLVQVTWEQAALFCNWLSAKESLPSSYIRQGDELVGVEPMRTGYRLPTEAEWEYCSRFNGNKALLKYPWGVRFPPTKKIGNFADIAAKDLVSNYLENYDDGYPVTAPPGAFEPNTLGLYDMGGNVAEWCHDYYSIYPYSADKVYVDPLGPIQGRHRVIKGSSWKHSSIGELRLSCRDYSNDKRYDVGLRICRYLADASAEK